MRIAALWIVDSSPSELRAENVYGTIPANPSIRWLTPQWASTAAHLFLSNMDTDDLYPHTLIGTPDSPSGLIPDLTRFQSSAPLTGDLCFRLPSGEEVYSHTILFFPDTINDLSSPTAETDSRGLRVRTIPPENVPPFQRTVQLADIDTVIQTLQAHHRRGTGGFEIVVKNPATETVEGTFHVHRTLLKERIPYFSALFSGGYKDSTSSSGVLWSDTVTLKAAEVVKAWCYLSFPFGKLLEEVETILDTAVAADFLSIPDLQNWCFSQLHKLAVHGGDGSITDDILPRIISGLYTRPQLERGAGGLYTTALRQLAQMGCIPKLWKRRVIELPDDVLEELVAAVTQEVGDSSQSAFRLFLTVSQLRRKVGGSKVRDRWEEKLVVPLMRCAAGVAARGLGDGYFADRVRRLGRVVGFERAAVEEMVLAVAEEVGEGNCAVIYEGLVRMPEGEEVVRRAREVVGAWLKRNWLSMSVVERNVFEREWKGEMVERLAGELGVEREDLLGNRRRRRGVR
ncbi:hypothetical protein K440DRAFT_660018 [Wilcoxina mikolae CBS 423.85]|nr:hypothetical protein K440DRAFT_660018 [Wilcoxina mikolae CBS 423.85]